MNVKVLGPGCARCKKQLAEVQAAVERTGVDAQVEKLERIEDIMRFGVMSTPALVIDGVVRCSGRVAAATEIAAWLAPADT